MQNAEYQNVTESSKLNRPRYLNSPRPILRQPQPRPLGYLTHVVTHVVTHVHTYVVAHVVAYVAAMFMLCSCYVSLLCFCLCFCPRLFLCCLCMDSGVNRSLIFRT